MNKKSKTLEEKRDELLELHKEQISQINTRIKDKEKKDKEKQRKLNTRRKIIIGALAKKHMEKNKGSEFEKILLRLMDEYVIKDYERALFDLPKLEEEEQKLRLKKHAEERKKEKDIESMNIEEN